MHRWNRSTTDSARGLVADEDGSASVEFIVAGVILLVPLVYLILTLGSIQQHTLGVEAAARHTARTLATAPNAEVGNDRADAVLAAVADQYGIDPATLQIDVSCTEPGACPAAGQTLIVTVQASTTLPLVPPVFGLDQATRVPVEAMSVQKVGRTWTG